MKYRELVEAVGALHQTAGRRIAAVANQALVLRNWLIGARIVEFQQAGEDRATYGQRLLDRLAQDLRRTGVPGCSSVMLGRMRLLYQRYPQIRDCFPGDVIPSSLMTEFPAPASDDALNRIPSSPMTESASPLQPLSCQLILRLSWSKLIELLRIEDPMKRAFYENACLAEGWSVAEIQRQIGSLLYERTGLSSDKAARMSPYHHRLWAGRTPTPLAQYLNRWASKPGRVAKRCPVVTTGRRRVVGMNEGTRTQGD
jgi:hypothetical protein